MLARHNVFDVEGNERRRLLRNAAIFTGVSGSHPNEVLEAKVHLRSVLCEKTTRFRLNDRNQVNGFDEVLVFGVFVWGERPLVRLVAQLGS
jgi:hypothetical protein